MQYGECWSLCPAHKLRKGDAIRGVGEPLPCSQTARRGCSTCGGGASALLTNTEKGMQYVGWGSLSSAHKQINYTLSGLLYPEWQHRQCFGLAFRRSHVRGSECSKSCGLQPALHCAIRGAQGILPCVGLECDQSILSTVSDAIVRSWLWSAATRSSPLGCFTKLLQVVDNWTHILW